MDHLTTLPAENLVQIYCSSPDITTAIQLSKTNSRLRNVWLQHEEHIAEAILRPVIPAYDDAVALARDTALKSTPFLSGIENVRPRIQWMPQLLSNARRASNVITEHLRWFANHLPDYEHEDMPYSAYYTTRRARLSWDHPELQQKLKHQLRIDADHNERYRAYSVCIFMMHCVDRKEQDSHGIIDKDWVPFEDRWGTHKWVEGWRHAYALLLNEFKRGQPVTEDEDDDNDDDDDDDDILPYSDAYYKYVTLPRELEKWDKYIQDLFSNRLPPSDMPDESARDPVSKGRSSS